MPRYHFCGNDPDLLIVVGWDNPLETYFAQVWTGTEPGEGTLQLWIGTTRGEVATIETLTRHLAPFGEIPEEVLAQLRVAGQQRSQPTPLQKLVGK